jgi:hypothetical protein
VLILVEGSFISCLIAFETSGLQRIVKEVEVLSLQGYENP